MRFIIELLEMVLLVVWKGRSNYPNILAELKRQNEKTKGIGFLFGL
jgi:hypothetical protein